MEHSRLLPQLSKLQVPSVTSVSRQEVEPVDLCWAARVVPVSQVHFVHVPLIEARRRGRQGGSSQQQITVPGQLGDHVAQVGGGGIRVGELQVLAVNGCSGAFPQPEAAVALQGGGDAVAALDAEDEGTAAG